MTVSSVAYDVLVRQTNKHYVATVLGLPLPSVEAETREQAIARARDAVEELLSQGEVVRIEVTSSTPSWKSFAGMWADDTRFDDFRAAMDAYRAEVDANPDQP